MYQNNEKYMESRLKKIKVRIGNHENDRFEPEALQLHRDLQSTRLSHRLKQKYDAVLGEAGFIVSAK